MSRTAATLLLLGLALCGALPSVAGAQANDVSARLERLKRERQRPTFEMPYGRAWFLRLALDYAAVFHSALPTPMGDFVAGSLMEYYRGIPPDPEGHEYENASWALINFYDYEVAALPGRGNQPGHAGSRS